MTIEDRLCKVLQRQFKCSPTPDKCKGNFIKTTRGEDYMADVCYALKRICRITWEDELNRR